MVLEKTLECPLDYKETQLVHPKGDQSWVFIGRTDAETEALILWPPNAKSWLIGKDPDARKVWRQEKGMTEDEMGRRYHWLNGHEFEQVPGDGDGQGSLACCSLLCCRVEHNRAAEQQQLPYVQEQIKPKASRWPLTREDMGMANKQKTFSTSFISREVKTVMRCYSTATKMAEI